MGTPIRTYRRRKIWVNSHFQAKYTVLMAGVAALILGVLAYLYADLKSEQNRLLGLQKQGAPAVAADDSADEFDRELQGKAAEGDRKNVVALVGLAALLVALLAYVGVRVTFRAAGPVFAVSQMLKVMAAGDFASTRRLREGDEFRFLEEDVGAVRATLRRMAAEDAALLARAAESLRSGGGPATADLARDLDEARGTKVRTFGLEKA
jgi:methyl-accepting chemotaxis protein